MRTGVQDWGAGVFSVRYCFCLDNCIEGFSVFITCVHAQPHLRRVDDALQGNAFAKHGICVRSPAHRPSIRDEGHLSAA